MTVLKLTGVTKFYSKFCALADVNLTLTPGIYGLLGANGAGKSTLVKAIAGVHEISSGSILFDTKLIDDKYLENVGYLPQNPMLYPNYTAYEFLEYICILKGIKKSNISNEIEYLLSVVNLSNDKKKIGRFSGGMRQRLGIAQALVNNPKILILDEPTAGLDPQERLRFRNILSRLSTDKIVILATHIVSDIQNVAKEIILLKDGKVLCIETPDALSNLVSDFVWSVSDITIEEYEVINSQSIVSNVKIVNEKVSVKVLPSKSPHINAVSEIANLEDVYLYFFGDNQ